LVKDPKHIRSFTSRKLEILDAISMDPRVTAAEFRVAYRLIQHQNAETGAIFPSQDRLASQIGVKERTVRANIAGLVKKGWLDVNRRNMRTANLYAFKDKHVNEILDRQITLNETRKAERVGLARPTVDRQLNDAQTMVTGKIMPVVTGSEMTVNTSTLHLNKNHIEEKKPQDNAYAVASGKVA
jgi:DNA-binding transcriptional MocR family regulator